MSSENLCPQSSVDDVSIYPRLKLSDYYSLPSTEHLHIQRSFESDPDISLSSLIGYYTAALSPDVYLLADLVMVSRPVSA